jgi:DNA-binding CsgD family transcriptional regulator
MNADDHLLQVQRSLRRCLFEGPGAIRWRPGRELAAQLLLYLDDPRACWRITTEWLRDTLDADRVDGGFGGFMQAGGRPTDYVVLAEAQREASRLPSALGRRFGAANPGLRVLWGPARITAMADVAQERTLTTDLRGTLLSMGTAAKLALPLRDGAEPIGLMCADWHVEAPRWDSEACNQLPALASEALGPLLRSAAQLAQERERQQGLLLPAPGSTQDCSAAVPPDLGALTPAELKVAHLASTGLTYKEIARHLDRSLSTVDHQLRAVRDKLGVRSTARLVHVLSEHFERSKE